MEGLKNNGIEVLALIHKEGVLKNLLIKNKINFIQTNIKNWEDKKSTFLNILQILLITPFVIKLLISLDIDLVHINDGKTRNTWTIAAKILNLKIIIHQRTIYDKSRISYLLSFLPNKIICISNFVKESMPIIFHKKIKTVSNPFEEKDNLSKKKSKYNLCSQLSINSENHIISVIGTVNEQKRSIQALKTLEILIEKGIKATLIYVGKISNENRNLIESEINKKQIKESTRIIGFEDDIEDFLCGSDYIIAPAANEGFGRVLIEAMLHFTPVIASDHGGHKEIIRSHYNGFLFNIEDHQEMAKIIERLIKSPNLYLEVTNNAKEFASKTYNKKKHIDEILKIYNL